MAAEAGAGADPQRPLRRAARGRQFLRHVLDIAQDALRPAQHRQPSSVTAIRRVVRCSSRAPRCGLEQADPLADERGRGAQLHRRRREAALAQHHAEQPQIGERRQIMHDLSRSTFQQSCIMHEPARCKSVISHASALSRGEAHDQAQDRGDRRRRHRQGGGARGHARARRGRPQVRLRAPVGRAALELRLLSRARHA